MGTTPAVVARQGRLDYKWIVALVVVFGSFMSILDQMVVNNALPTLQKAFATDLSGVQWVVTAYTLTQGVMTPTTAFFADRFGSKRFYIIALSVFTLGSALCGLAWNLPTMIVFRVIQGTGGAVLFPLAIALLFREFPPQQRGIAAAIIGISALMAPAAGPTLGGYIVTYASWPLIFLINVPVGLVGIALAVFLLREVRSQERRRFDPWGFVLVASGLATVLYGLSEVTAYGWGSARVLAILGGGLLILAVFVVFELRRIAGKGQPLLELGIFANRAFLISNIANALISLAFFGSLILFPLYTQNLRGLNAFQAGLLTLPLAITSIISALIGGKLIDRFGPRFVLIPGIILIVVTTYPFTQMDLNTSFGWLVAVMAVRGIGLGWLLQPLTVTAMSEIPMRHYAQASSLNSVVRFVFTTLGIAVMASMVQSRASDHIGELVRQARPTSEAALQLLKLQGMNEAIQDAFWLSLIVLVVSGVVICLIRMKRVEVVKAGEQKVEGEEEAIVMPVFE